MLYRNGLIMYDRETESLWSHILGQAIGGEFAGTQLEFIPVLHTDWKTWKERHPETLVVSPALFGRDPYESYYASAREGVIGRGPISGGGPERGDDIHPKEYVIGVRLDGEAKAYPFSVLGDEPVIAKTLNKECGFKLPTDFLSLPGAEDWVEHVKKMKARKGTAR